jgi:hypothetical protein
MTSALVAYESLFGDARTIARAIAEGSAGSLPAEAVSAGEAPATIGAARLHCRIVAPAEHFSVTTAEGPLAAGEEERARRWGITLGRQVGSRTTAGG